MEHNGRGVHMVGSVPAASVDEAMRWMLTGAGDHLRSLPDGEPGLRSRWIVHMIEALRGHPDFRLVRDGDWSSYQDVPRFGLLPGHRLHPQALQLGIADVAAESWAVYAELCRQMECNGLTFQCGIPSYLDLALFSFGPLRALWHLRAFRAAVIREVRRAYELTHGDIVMQLEAPAELVFTGQAPSAFQPLLVRWLARGLARVAAAAPSGARFGVHLCLGDLEHQALGGMRTAAPAVRLANAAARAWPAGRELEYVHIPLAAGTHSPVLRHEFYTPLRRLKLPARTRVVAGVAHEDQDLDTQRRVLAWVEDAVGHTVDVAAACGLGRRTRAAAQDVLDRCVALATPGTPSDTAHLGDAS